MLRYVMSLCKDHVNHLCDSAAGAGNLNVLKWLRGYGRLPGDPMRIFDWSSETFFCAVSWGRLHVLEWMIMDKSCPENGNKPDICEWSPYAIEEAKNLGDANLLKWLLEHQPQQPE
jgi:hypothetical protein